MPPSGPLGKNAGGAIPPLHYKTGGGKGGRPKSASSQQVGPSLEEIIQMIKSSEEKTEVKIAAVETKIEARLASLADKKLAVQIGVSIVGAMFAVAGGMLAILAFAGDRFDGGLDAGTAIGEKFSQNTIEIQRNSDRDEALRKDVQSLLQGMNTLINRMDGDANEARASCECTAQGTD